MPLMRNDKRPNNAIRAVLTTVESALRVGVTRDQIVQAIQRGMDANVKPEHRKREPRKLDPD
jgi:hypothetical protein